MIDDRSSGEIDALARLAPLHNPPARRGHPPCPGDVPRRAAGRGLRHRVLRRPAAGGRAPTPSTGALAQREASVATACTASATQYVAAAAAAVPGPPAGDLDQIVLHLGNGASAAAIRGGRPVDTSMGLTPLEGLVMGTRAGDLDPGAAAAPAAPCRGARPDGLEDLLHHRSGLEGMAGHHDFRDLLARRGRRRRGRDRHGVRRLLPPAAQVRRRLPRRARRRRRRDLHRGGRGERPAGAGRRAWPAWTASGSRSTRSATTRCPVARGGSPPTPLASRSSWSPPTRRSRSPGRRRPWSR